MSTVLYLANQQIQAVTGNAGQKKVTVHDTYIADVPEGSIINGIIMDTESFIPFIREFWQKNNLPVKDVILVINSSKFVGKTIELPKLKDSKTLEYIEREFTDVKKEEDEIYGYIPLVSADENIRRIYAESISAEFIKEYTEIFKEAGIGIKAIYSGESSLIGLAGITLATEYRTFMMLIADNITLTTLLWVDGSFYHFNSIRCFHEQGTEEYAMDVARNVSQIIQFMKARQIEHELETIRIAGIQDVDEELYRSALSGQGIDVPMAAFNSAKLSARKSDIQNYLHAASGLILNGKCQNFLTMYSSRKRKKSAENQLGKGTLAVLVTFVAMVVITIICFGVRIVKQNRLFKLEAENTSMEVIEQITEYDGLLARNTFLGSQYDAILDIDENLMTYPVCNNKVIDMIQNCAGTYATVQIDSFDADSGEVKLTASTENVENSNKFIAKLNEQGIFNAYYTGYSYDNQSNLWDIHVTCTLTEAAGR